ncbi:MAG: long-chain fatty acid--CoA ligase [Promethearchaeota archaeon]|nr:MAG: long-chain fatty acid--CoA ligase [Candidatus Lokiarchaeota archaeon]
MGNKWNKYFEIEKHENLAAMVLATVDKYGKKVALRWFDEEDESKIQELTYNELKNLMHMMYGGLASLGLRKSDMIALCCETRAEWVYIDLGIQSLGGVNVAIYPSLKPKEILYILTDSGAKAIFVDTQENLEKVLAIEDQAENLSYIIVIDEFDESLDKENIISLDQLLNEGVQYNRTHMNQFIESIYRIEEDDLASLIYTSGTTGIPKGVMLTHKNFLSDAYLAVSVTATLRKAEKPWEMDMLSLLPYAHSFGRCVNEYCGLYIGAAIDIVSELNPEKIRRALEEFKPTIIVGIPYLFQKMYNIVQDTVDSLPSAAQNIFGKAEALGREWAKYKTKGEKGPLGLRIKFGILGNLVRLVLNKKMGGRLKLMISGSAAIAEELMIFFNMFKFNLIEGYGLTETSPVTHMLRTAHNSNNHPEINKEVDEFTQLGSIGPTIDIEDNPYEPVEQKLTPEGELLIRGPMVMKGYWNKPKLTAAALDEEGWLHTGDLAEIDENGYVRIKGRAKVVVKLQTGKMISPAAVENLIVPASKKVAQIILVGDDTRKYLTCIVVPYQKPFKEWADQNNFPYESWKDIITHGPVLEMIKKEVIAMLDEVSDYMTPKKFLISCKDFRAEEDYLTPTYKFKRSKIMEDLKAWIDKLYANNEDILIIEERITDFYDQSLIIG